MTVASVVRPALCSCLFLLLSMSACQEPAPAPGGTRVERPRFSGSRALAHVQTQVGFGPRIPGTDGHAQQLAWMQEYLGQRADTVVADSFQHRASDGETLDLVNVIAGFNLAADRRLLLLAHWDTRPKADQSRNETEREMPVPGANDGASGVAVLLELAHLFSTQAPTVGVDLLFVDGEDYGPGGEDMYLGARHFASHFEGGEGSPTYAVLLDMVGDVDPSFPAEAYSSEHAPQVVQRVWGVARDLGYGRYFPMRVGPRVNDDHVPLNEAGIPTVDVIDFEYGPGNALWHTPDDGLDAISATTLGMVGEVMAELVYRGG